MAMRAALARGLCSSRGGKNVAEDMARKIVHELRSAREPFPSVEELGEMRAAPAQLAKYALSRALLHHQGAGAAIHVQTPRAATDETLAPADELLVRAVGILEKERAARPTSSAAPLSAPSTKTERQRLAALLHQLAATSTGADAPDAQQVLSAWRSSSETHLTGTVATLSELQGLRAHLLACMELDARTRAIDVQTGILRRNRRLAESARNTSSATE
mmetsp:Transcript_21055/g.56688  ORF Transcript_21055/g.56688 Transcript_21055/m.56688 type:complete len:218 (+) Transcript_21055:13-666(+)